MNDPRTPLKSRDSVRKVDFARSGLVTTVFLAVLLLVLYFLFHERGKGHLHKLTTVVPVAPMAPPAQPGGTDAITIGRFSLVNGAAPEFISSTLLPGLGMSVLDLRASFPLRGEVPVLSSVTLQQIADEANRRIADPATPPQNDSRAIAVSTSPLLAWISDKALDSDDLGSAAINLQRAESAENHAMPDGGDTTAVFSAQPQTAPGHMPPNIEMRTSALMSGRAFELSLTARNAGNTTVPLRIGWMPHLIMPGKDRSQWRLVIPTDQRLSAGKTVSAHDTRADFTSRVGQAIGGEPVDITLTHLTRDFMSPGCEMQLLDPKSGYGLRLITLTPNIRSVRIVAPAGADWVSIIPIADAMDTLANRVAGVRGETQTHGLAPGATMHWKIRLELFELTKSGEAPDGP